MHNDDDDFMNRDGLLGASICACVFAALALLGLYSLIAWAWKAIGP